MADDDTQSSAAKYLRDAQASANRYLRVCVLRPFWARGRLRKEGTWIELPEPKARFRIESGEAWLPPRSTQDALADDPHAYELERGVPIVRALQLLFPDAVAELIDQGGAPALRALDRERPRGDAHAAAALRHYAFLALGTLMDLRDLLKAAGDDRHEVYATALPAGAGPDVAAVRIEPKRWGRDLAFKVEPEETIRALIGSGEIAVNGLERFRDIRIHRVRRAAASSGDAQTQTNVVALQRRGDAPTVPAAAAGDQRTIDPATVVSNFGEPPVLLLKSRVAEVLAKADLEISPSEPRHRGWKKERAKRVTAALGLPADKLESVAATIRQLDPPKPKAKPKK